MTVGLTPRVMRPSGKPNGATVLMMLTGICSMKLRRLIFVVVVLTGTRLLVKAWVLVV